MAPEPHSFLGNWRSLSFNLQLHILSLIVTIRSPNQNRILAFADPANHTPYWHLFEFRRTVIPLLSIPEIKSLAHQAFYANNCFEIHFDPWRYTGEPPRGLHGILPRFPVRRSVRRLYFMFDRFDERAFETLGAVSRALGGFDGLEFVEVVMSRPCEVRREAEDAFWRYLGRVGRLEFPVKCLRVASSHFPVGHFSLADGLETAVLEKFGIGDAGEDVDTRCALFVIGLVEMELREVDGWAPHTTVEHELRWTVRETFAKGYRLESFPRFTGFIDVQE